MNMEGVKLRIEYFLLRLRDKLGIPFKPEEEIKKINLKAGQTVLDYGCGIGSCTIPAARLVGKGGKVYALDKQPLAIRKVKERAQKGGFHIRNLY
jgi:ubiquinone/menaquinone biosynthesis C-methylase UbiE